MKRPGNLAPTWSNSNTRSDAEGADAIVHTRNAVPGSGVLPSATARTAASSTTPLLADDNALPHPLVRSLRAQGMPALPVRCWPVMHLVTLIDLQSWLASHLLWVRFAKLLAVLAFVVGAVGASVVRDPADREGLGLRVAPLGFVTTWMCGFALAWAEGLPLLTGWILLGALLSFGVVSAVAALALRPQPTGRVGTCVVLAVLIGCVAAMVFKPGH